MARFWRKRNLGAFMHRRGINARILAHLLHVTKSSVDNWARIGMIPTKHVTALNAITKEQTDALRTWIPYDVATLREALGDISQKDLAELLDTIERNISYWQRDWRIPRTLLPQIKWLETEARR